MAKKPKKKAPVTPTLRGALTNIQREGKRLAGRVERDVRRLVRRTQVQLTTDAKTLRREVGRRVQRVTRDLDGRASAARREVERRLEALENAVRSRLGVAGTDDVGALQQQLAALGRRLDDLEQRLRRTGAGEHD